MVLDIIASFSWALYIIRKSNYKFSINSLLMYHQSRGPYGVHVRQVCWWAWSLWFHRKRS